ncbi:hypothetical protein YC2023_077295 [Brassica napus]
MVTQSNQTTGCIVLRILGSGMFYFLMRFKNSEEHLISLIDRWDNLIDRSHCYALVNDYCTLTNQRRQRIFEVKEAVVVSDRANASTYESSDASGSSKRVEQLKPLVIKPPTEDEIEDGRKKVTIFFSTQTGTAKGFAKVSCFEIQNSNKLEMMIGA